jgi:hypothetical protein
MSRSTRKSSKVRALKPLPPKQATAKAVKGGTVKKIGEMRGIGAGNRSGL